MRYVKNPVPICFAQDAVSPCLSIMIHKVSYFFILGCLYLCTSTPDHQPASLRRLGGNVFVVGWLSRYCRLRQQVKLSGIRSVSSCWDKYTPLLRLQSQRKKSIFAGTTNNLPNVVKNGEFFRLSNWVPSLRPKFDGLRLGCPDYFGHTG